MNYSKGISWFDDCRIPFVEADSNINFDRPRLRNKEGTDWILSQAMDYTNPDYKEYNKQGRFPANLLCSDDVLNDGSISNGKVGMTQQASPNQIYGKFNSKEDTKINDGITDKGTNSRYYDIDAWFNNLLENNIY